MNESSHQQCVNESENLLRNLNHLRRQHNLTQKQMAQTLGISITTWRKMEQGIMPPRLSSLVVYRVADAFGIPAIKLFSKTP
jgi:transcriptional regulator with XRE-family HTH domain